MLQNPGGGCQLIVEVPVSVSTHRLLLVRTAGRTFALGMRGLDSLHRVTNVHTVEGRSVIMHEGRPVPLVTLGPACGLPPSLVRHEDGHLLVAVLKGDRPLALNVEEFVGETSASSRPCRIRLRCRRTSQVPFFWKGAKWLWSSIFRV